MPRKKMEESRGCFAPAVAILVISILLVLGRAWSEETVSLDFVDSKIQEVARSVSLAYGVPVLVDGDVDARVTFHLEGVGLLEGLSSLCSTLGLEVFRDGSVLRIRHAVPRGENFFSVSDSLVTLSVEGRDIHDFVRDFSMNTGLNVVVAPEVSGKVSGTLRSVRAEDALRVLLGAHGFRVVRESGCFRVVPRRQESKGGGLYSVTLDGASVADFLRELSRVAGLNLVMYGDIQERAHLRVEGLPLESLLESLFRGSRYTYALDSNSLSVAERGAKNVLSVTSFYPLRHGNPEMLLPQLQKLQSAARRTCFR